MRSIAPNLPDLEPAPHGKISFGPYGQQFNAVSLEVDFDETNVSPTSLNVYIPEVVIGGALGANQRMAYWRQDGDKLYIDIISPDSISTQFLKVYVMHPRGITTPGFAINSATFYDQNGLDITATASITSVLDYYPR